MTSRIISVREEIYKELNHLRENNESFSDIISSLIKKYKKDPLSHFGIGSDLPDEVNDAFEEAILNAKAKRIEIKKQNISKTIGETI